MKLIYLANLRLPTEKAYGIQIAKMCEAFASEGLDTTLAFPYRRNPRIKEDIYSYYSVKNNFKTKKVRAFDIPEIFPEGLPGLNVFFMIIKNFYSANMLVREALKENYDIYYTRDERIAKLLKEKKKNVIFECHRFSNRRKSFYSYFKNNDLKIVAISDGLKEDLIKFGIRDSNILVARDGVDLGEFDIGMSKKDARLGVGLTFDRKIAMYTGHLFEWKGVGVILEAARQCGEIVFVFIGGMSRDIENFKKKVTELSLTNVLILGNKPHKEIPVFLKAADVLILPNSTQEEISKFYTSPLKLFEYMASSRPIVASALPSIMEVLNGKNSVLVKSDDPDSLVEGIKKVINDDMLSREVAKKALEDVQEYTWQKRSEKILNFLSNYYEK